LVGSSSKIGGEQFKDWCGSIHRLVGAVQRLMGSISKIDGDQFIDWWRAIHRSVGSSSKIGG